MSLPIIDFSKCGIQVSEVENVNLQQAGEQLYQAFSTAGFAYLSNTGIKSEVYNGLTKTTQHFFNKSMDYKESFIGDITFGYDKKGETRVSPNRPYDYQEGFHFTGKSMTDTALVWPGVPHFETDLKKFADRCKKLTLRILSALGKGMMLKDPRILEKSHNFLNCPGNHTALRVIHYPEISPNDKLLPNQIRIGEHADWGTITLLFQDAIGGLQIKTSEGSFVDVTPIPDTIVINIGDMLSLWSGGDLKSTIHRVIIPDDPDLRKRARKSVVYFVNADDDTVLSRLQYESLEKNSIYRKNTNIKETMTASDYINDRYNIIFGNK